MPLQCPFLPSLPTVADDSRPTGLKLAKVRAWATGLLRNLSSENLPTVLRSKPHEASDRLLVFCVSFRRPAVAIQRKIRRHLDESKRWSLAFADQLGQRIAPLRDQLGNDLPDECEFKNDHDR